MRRSYSTIEDPTHMCDSTYGGIGNVWIFFFFLRSEKFGSLPHRGECYWITSVKHEE